MRGNKLIKAVCVEKEQRITGTTWGPTDVKEINKPPRDLLKSKIPGAMNSVKLGINFP